MGSPFQRLVLTPSTNSPQYRTAFRALTHASISRLEDLRLERAMAAFSSAWRALADLPHVWACELATRLAHSRPCLAHFGILKKLTSVPHAR